MRLSQEILVAQEEYSNFMTDRDLRISDLFLKIRSIKIEEPKVNQWLWINFIYDQAGKGQQEQEDLLVPQQGRAGQLYDLYKKGPLP